MTPMRTDFVVRRALRAMCVACFIAAPGAASDAPSRDEPAPPAVITRELARSFVVHTVMLCPPGRFVPTSSYDGTDFTVSPDRQHLAVVHYARDFDRGRAFDPVLRLIDLTTGAHRDLPIPAAERVRLHWANDGRLLCAATWISSVTFTIDMPDGALDATHPIGGFLDGLSQLPQTGGRYQVIPILDGSSAIDGDLDRPEEHLFLEGPVDLVIHDHHTGKRVLFESSAIYHGVPDIWTANDGMIVMRGERDGPRSLDIYAITAENGVAPVARVTGDRIHFRSFNLTDHGTIDLLVPQPDGTTVLRRIAADASTRDLFHCTVDTSARRMSSHWLPHFGAPTGDAVGVCGRTDDTLHLLTRAANGDVRPWSVTSASAAPLASIARGDALHLLSVHATTDDDAPVRFTITSARDGSWCAVETAPRFFLDSRTLWSHRPSENAESIDLVDLTRWTLDDDDFTPPAPPE